MKKYHRLRKLDRGLFPLILVIIAVLAIIVVGAIIIFDKAPFDTFQQIPPTQTKIAPPDIQVSNPLYGKVFYRDDTRVINTKVRELEKAGNKTDAELLKKVSAEPGVTWLTGPLYSDPLASHDIEEVKRTSKAASDQGTIPIYQLYAIPIRDACASHSKGGFTNSAAYLAWIDKIIANLYTPAVISIEADAIAHTLNPGCLTDSQIGQRYALLNEVTLKFKASPKVLAAYLDAGHSDWWPNPSVLVDPLRKSGINNIRGVAVNVSFFAETSSITVWAQQLVKELDADKGVIIDTSRNGKGIAPVKGDRRWCNPEQRGIGPKPGTMINSASIDAFVWIKNIGESDGTCGGYPPAGTFVTSIALELARNAITE